MFKLHEDPNFHYEALRSLGLARYMGGDIGEQLAILPKIKPGDVEGWYHEWSKLARRVLSTIDESQLHLYHPATLKDVFFRASHYFFVADFFIHGDRNDPRLKENWTLWRKYFDLANAQLPIPGKHAVVPTSHGFHIPIISYRAPEASASNPRPTLIVGGGFDSNYEECLHVFGFSALERGYNVILYEGPGQPSLLQEQNVGFIHDWEKAVTPIVDYILDHAFTEFSFVDTSKLGLVGMSLGGYLAAHAAAFEPRLAAVLCIDGVYDFLDCLIPMVPAEVHAAYMRGDETTFNAHWAAIDESSSTNERWSRDHLRYSFRSDNVYQIYKQEVEKMTLKDIAHQIKMPALIGEAEGDLFFGQQPAQVAKAIGGNATLFSYTSEQAADAHCQSGALSYLGQTMWEWFAGVIGEKP